jgi:hypothetical protein
MAYYEEHLVPPNYVVKIKYPKIVKKDHDSPAFSSGFCEDAGSGSS